jgi:hypothetical protein
VWTLSYAVGVAGFGSQSDPSYGMAIDGSWSLQAAEAAFSVSIGPVSGKGGLAVSVALCYRWLGRRKSLGGYGSPRASPASSGGTSTRS